MRSELARVKDIASAFGVLDPGQPFPSGDLAFREKRAFGGDKLLVNMRHTPETLSARRQELLGEYDLVKNITLFGPAYAENSTAISLLIHERSHSIVGNVTTYGTFQKGLAILSRSAVEPANEEIGIRAGEALDWVLDNSYDADEGYAMSRERDVAALLGVGFDPDSMPDDYARALASFDRLFAGYIPKSAGLRILLLQGITEAVFNTTVLAAVSPEAVLHTHLELERIIAEDQRPDFRLRMLEDVCRCTDILEVAERGIESALAGRISVDGKDGTIDEAITASFRVPGVGSDQRLRLMYLAASMTMHEALIEVGATAFGTGPKDAISQNIPWLSELSVKSRQQGIAMPIFRGASTPEDERLAEDIRYAPQVKAFEVAWALPSLVAGLAKERKLFFFNQPSQPPTNLPPGFDAVDMAFLTVFALRPSEHGAETAYWTVQLAVPFTSGDAESAQAVLSHVVDDVVVMTDENAVTLEFPEVDAAALDDTIAVLPNTDIHTIESLLLAWAERETLDSARRVTSIGPIVYFELRFAGKPRVFLRMPVQVFDGIRDGRSAVRELLPTEETAWELDHHRTLARVFCHLCEAGAFFGEKGAWHEDFVDDLMIAGVDFEFRDLGTI